MTPKAHTSPKRYVKIDVSRYISKIYLSNSLDFHIMVRCAVVFYIKFVNLRKTALIVRIPRKIEMLEYNILKSSQQNSLKLH